MTKRKRRLPKSVRVHIRREKARIRAQFPNTQEVEEKIHELVEKVSEGHAKRIRHNQQ